jgi:hypothetical protein
MSAQTLLYSRRLTSRVNARDGVLIYWQCNGRDETSRIRDLSLGGLFVETTKSGSVGSKAKIDFLVQEGQIRAEAIVQRIEPGHGLGLKFSAMKGKDRPNLDSLMKRLRSCSP